MLLTLVVWIYMYIRRTSYLLREKIDLRKVDTPKRQRLWCREQSASRHTISRTCLNCLSFSTPVCLYLFVSDSVDGIYLAAAWWFFGFRVVHSLIHCTYNKVEHRFAVYMLAAIGLWVMVIRASIKILGII